MTKLFIFNNGSRAAGYGIGTYVTQMSEAMSSVPGYEVSLIEMCSYIKDFEISRDTTGVYRYRIPGVPTGNEDERYLRSAFYFLARHIDIEDGDRIVFHFNYYQHLLMARLLKGHFPECRIIFTVHYFNWCFEIQGNITRFKEIIESRKDIYDNGHASSDETEASIQKSFGVEREFLHLADEVIALSENTLGLLREDYGVARGKIHLIYNGLGNKIIKAHRTYECHTRNVVFVGRLDKIKGLGYLIDAFAEVADKYPDVTLQIAGDGDFQPYMDKARKVCGKVSFLGKMNPEELESLYQSAYIGAIPSFHEQCSYTAIEMMRHGVPFIGTDSTGLGEMLDIVPELRVHIDETDFDGDSFTKEIVSGMDLMLGDSELRDRASEKFLSRYNDKHRAVDMVFHYRSVVSSAFHRTGNLSSDYLDYLDYAMMRLIDKRPEIDTEIFGMSGIGIYLWWRAIQLKGNVSERRKYATIMEYLVYYIDWLEESAKYEGLPEEMSKALTEMERSGLCQPTVRRILERNPPLTESTPILSSTEIITNALKICNCKV